MSKMIDDDGVEWVDMGNGNAYCPELKDGMVAMMVGGSLVLMPPVMHEAMMQAVFQSVDEAMQLAGKDSVKTSPSDAH